MRQALEILLTQCLNMWVGGLADKEQSSGHLFWLMDAALWVNGRFAIGRRYAAIGVWCVSSKHETVAPRARSLNTYHIPRWDLICS